MQKQRRVQRMQYVKKTKQVKLKEKISTQIMKYQMKAKIKKQQSLRTKRFPLI